MSFLHIQGDARQLPLRDGSVQCVVTSPPYYGLRAYLSANHKDKRLEIGLESSLDAYVSQLVQVFREVRRVLRSDGVCFLNLGDSYAGSGVRSGNPGGRTEKQITNAGSYVSTSSISLLTDGLKPKDLCGVPWRVALALQADGWWLRSDIIWSKPNPMPESVRDRPTRSHEYIFMLTKSERYFWDQEAIKEPNVTQNDKREDGGRYSYCGKYTGAHGNKAQRAFVTIKSSGRNMRSVWSIATEPFPGSHFATMPTEIVKRCILAGCPKGGIVADPFGGAGTTALQADRLGRHGISLDLSRQYVEMGEQRSVDDAPLLATLRDKPAVFVARQPGLFDGGGDV